MSQRTPGRVFPRKLPLLSRGPQPGHIYWTDLQGINEFDRKRPRPTLCLVVGEPRSPLEAFDSDRDGTVFVAPLTTHDWHGVWGVNLGSLSPSYPPSYALSHRLLLLRPERLVRLLTVVDRHLVDTVLNQATKPESGELGA